MEKEDNESIDFSANFNSPEFISAWGDTRRPKGSFVRRTLDGFKRDPNRRVNPKGADGSNSRVFDAGAAAQATVDSPLLRKLKGRHLQMIAIGGSIGMTLKGYHILVGSDKYPRYGFICRVRTSIGQRWSRITAHRLLCNRDNDILYVPCSGRARSGISRRRFVLGLFNPLPGSCMGIRHGLELCIAMVGRTSTRNRCCIDNYRLLGTHYSKRCVGSYIFGVDCHYKLIRGERIWRSGIRLLHNQSDCSHGIYVSYGFSYRPLQVANHHPVSLV